MSYLYAIQVLTGHIDADVGQGKRARGQQGDACICITHHGTAGAPAESRRVLHSLISGIRERERRVAEHGHADMHFHTGPATPSNKPRHTDTLEHVFEHLHMARCSRGRPHRKLG